MRRHRIYLIAPALVLGALVGFPHRMALPAASIPTPNYQFGVVEANLAVPQAKALGIGWTRVPLPWASLQPRRGSWNPYYTQHDQRLMALAGDGIVPVGIVQTVPAWASIDPAQAPDGVPSGLALPWTSPQNYWGQFMYQLAKHYAGLINTWIIGNEISIHAGRNKSFDGTTEQMAEMIRVASLAVHAANPAAIVEAPGAPYWYTKGRTTNALLTDLSRLPGAAQHHDFIDGLNLHIYNTVQWNALIYGSYRQMLERHGLARLPIWLSETNAAPGAPQDPGVTPTAQADFLVENLAASLQYVNHVEVYKMTNSPGGGAIHYGLLSASGSTGAPYIAVQTLGRVLKGSQFLHASVLPYEWDARSTPAVVTFGGVKKLINVVWDQGFQPTVVKLPAYAQQATVIESNGAYYHVNSTNGQFLLHLRPATIHSASTPTNAPIGGPPLILIQTVGMGEAGTPRTTPGNSPASFANPAPDMTAQKGNESVAVNPSDATVRITTAGSTVTMGGWGTASGELLGPSGLAIASNGNVYVSNSGAENVVEYTAGGQFVTAWGQYGFQAGQFNGPSGIAIGPHGTVYVADTLNQRIEAFSPSGAFEAQAAAPWPGTIEVLGSGQLQVTNVMTGARRRVSLPH